MADNEFSRGRPPKRQSGVFRRPNEKHHNMREPSERKAAPRPKRPDKYVPHPSRNTVGAYEKTMAKDDDFDERDYAPIRQSRVGKTGCFGGIMYFIFVVSISIILASLAWMAASDVLALNKPEHTATVTIPYDFTISDVSRILRDAGIIRYRFLFHIYSGLTNAEERIDPGTFELGTHLDYRAIVQKLRFGGRAQLRTTITFPEGFTVRQIFERLEEHQVARASDLMYAAANVDFQFPFLEGLPFGYHSRLEGFLFPDTYEFFLGMTPEAAISIFLRNFNRRVTPEMWEMAEQRGKTMHQIINIASMIEREAANNAERPLIASVIYNRINAGMRLDIDATILYILPEHRVILTLEDLAIDSPYNTRMHPGLPPTPIANPGLSSIMAALQPANTDMFFYALDMDTGTHRFFRTYAEHRAFVATQDYGW